MWDSIVHSSRTYLVENSVFTVRDWCLRLPEGKNNITFHEGNSDLAFNKPLVGIHHITSHHDIHEELKYKTIRKQYHKNSDQTIFLSDASPGWYWVPEAKSNEN